MENIIITADTTCSIYGEERTQLGIQVLPLNVFVDEVEFHDGVTITQKELVQREREGAKISTSTPTPYEIETFFDKVFAETKADHIIHFTISSKLSSMFTLFTTICKEKYQDKVTIVDSKLCCIFMGNMVRAAVADKNKGLSVKEIVANAEARKGKEICYFIPETLNYLVRGGRITPGVKMILNIIGKKPVLKFTAEGAVEKAFLTRTFSRACLDILNEFAQRKDINDYNLEVLDFGSPEMCQKAVLEAKEILPNHAVQITPISINVGAHTGPGTIGIGISLKY